MHFEKSEYIYFQCKELILYFASGQAIASIAIIRAGSNLPAYLEGIGPLLFVVIFIWVASQQSIFFLLQWSELNK